jgi:hypothetical protein
MRADHEGMVRFNESRPFSSWQFQDQLQMSQSTLLLCWCQAACSGTLRSDALCM